MPTDYEVAVSRNLGLVTAEEQQRLRRSRVALAGLGGVGGGYVLAFARMGIGNLLLADPDTFSLANTNRQVGASTRTYGRLKTEAMAEMAREIQPDIQIRRFDQGVTAENVAEFVAGADLIVDGLDFFAMPVRERLYPEARRQGKTVVQAGPLGFSGILQVFTPTGMTFHDYFDIHDGLTPFEKLVAFGIGVAPRGTHWKYMDMKRVRSDERTGPSIVTACGLCATLVGTEALAILLDRRPPFAVPQYLQFDPYLGVLRRGRLWFGNRGPIQRLKRWVAARMFRAQAAQVNGAPAPATPTGAAKP